MQNKIEDYQLEIYTILPPVPDRVKLDIFDRLNRGGTILNNQEMRNAMYVGTSTKILKKMSELDSFKQIVGNKINSITMKDRYLILRFLAFYLLRTNRLSGIEYKNVIDDFLADVMKFMNKYKIDEYEDIINDFDNAMKYILKNYNDAIFRFKNKEGKDRKRPINMALFECITYLFVLAVKNKKKVDINKLERLKKEKFDNPDRFTYGIDSIENINFRFNEVEKLL